MSRRLAYFGNNRIVKAKLVVVGDGECGKTSLLYAFIRDQFLGEYVPTVFENYVTEVTSDGRQLVELSIWDTAGQEEFDRLRPMSYPGSDVILMCFSVASRDSFSNIESHWLPEIRYFCGGDTPVILVGNKKDLRSNNKRHLVPLLQLQTRLDENSNNNNRIVSYDEAKALAREIGAFTYVECSAKTREGVAEVFADAARAVLSSRSTKMGPLTRRGHRKKRKAPCCMS